MTINKEGYVVINTQDQFVNSVYSYNDSEECRKIYSLGGARAALKHFNSNRANDELRIVKVNIKEIE